jgi:hypothetical protein
MDNVKVDITLSSSKRATYLYLKVPRVRLFVLLFEDKIEYVTLVE